MRRKLEKGTEQRTRAWPEQLEYVLTLEEVHELSANDYDAKSVAGVLPRLSAGRYMVVTRTEVKLGMQPLYDYIAALNHFGIDVGKGDSQYGFRMPLPKKGDEKRKLIVFRRE
ncbi:hypothetical protein HYT57_02935 [Candidatus Woesearchaeota archaeon]|nr:hypothetical protein [Candidatus Woesearchaeota archaeon]